VTGGWTNGASAPNFYPSNCNGINHIGPASVTPGGSPWTYLATLPGTLILNGGTVSAVAYAGHAVCSATPCLVPLNAGQSVQVTYSSAPTAVFNGQ
jgi:hypothetical protein